MKTRFLIIFWIVSQLVFAVSFQVEAQQFRLSTHITEEKGKQDPSIRFFDQHTETSRFRAIELSKEVQKKDIIKKGDTLLLNLFHDKQFQAILNRVGKNINGTVTLATDIIDQPYGYMVLSTTGNRSFGNIYLPAENLFYQIISDPETGHHYLTEMNLEDRDELPPGPVLVPPPPREMEKRKQEKIQQKIQQKNLSPDDHATITVMIAYTPAAREWARSTGAQIDNVIAAAMAEAQLSLDNSKTGITMALVHSAEVDYEESGDAVTDLYHFTFHEGFDPEGHNPEGLMSEVHEWRNFFGADLNALFAKVDDVGGLGFLLNTPAGRPEFGFSLTRVQQAAGLTHIHEMGHNMGAHHHTEQNSQPGPGIFPYSAGWRWFAPGSPLGYYCSLMTYGQGQFFDDGITHQRVPYFSNPDVMHEGVPTGDATKGDNARTLREVKHVISYYRPPQSVLTLKAENITTTTAKVGGQTVFYEGEEIFERGIYFGEEPNTEETGNRILIDDAPDYGRFSVTLEDLNHGKQYFVKAFANTNEGKVFGSETSFFTNIGITALAGPNGSIEPTGLIEVEYLGDKTFTISPDFGYHIKDILVNDISMGALETYSFKNISENQTIEARFAINRYMVSVESRAGEVSGAGEYDHGTEVTLSAHPFDNFVFNYWTEDGEPVSGDPDYSFTLLGERSLVANFSSTDNVLIYPNPAGDHLHVASNGSIQQVQIFDPSGKMVYSREKISITPHRINISGFSSGLYTIRVFNDEGEVHSEKAVITR